jgi:hypothetical protein
VLFNGLEKRREAIYQVSLVEIKQFGSYKIRQAKNLIFASVNEVGMVVGGLDGVLFPR